MSNIRHSALFVEGQDQQVTIVNLHGEATITFSSQALPTVETIPQDSVVSRGDGDNKIVYGFIGLPNVLPYQRTPQQHEEILQGIDTSLMAEAHDRMVRRRSIATSANVHDYLSECSHSRNYAYDEWILGEYTQETIRAAENTEEQVPNIQSPRIIHVSLTESWNIVSEGTGSLLREDEGRIRGHCESYCSESLQDNCTLKFSESCAVTNRVKHLPRSLPPDTHNQPNVNLVQVLLPVLLELDLAA